MSFTAKEYAREQGVSVTKARRMLEQLCHEGKASSFIWTGTNQLSPSEGSFLVPYRVRLYRFKEGDAGDAAGATICADR